MRPRSGIPKNNTRFALTMASKSTRETAAATAAIGESRVEVDRLIQKERFKDAVKQAKLCYKQENTPENHKLLEWAYFLRARQLVQLGMSASAVEVAQHLLEFGVTTSDWADEFIRLLMSVGLNKDAFTIQDRFGSPEKKDVLLVMAADEAVIHAERQQDSSPEIARDARLIRQSLAQVQARDEAGALLSLRDLARSSELSEWKFFIRGLVAYYRHDAVDVKANWDRLDPTRKAFAIAQKLLRLRETDGVKTGSANTESMEKLAFGEPVLDRLGQLSRLAANQDWDKVLRLLGPMSQSLRRIDPKLAERLTGALIGSIIKETEDLDLSDAERLVRGFTRVAEPLAFDPNWNRLWAIIWDGPQGDTEESLNYWLKYVEDLKTVAVFNSSERAMAQALVWNCMAGQHRDLAADLADGDGPFGLPAFRESPSGHDLPEVKRARKNVIECLDRSLKLAPDHLPTYQLLVEAYRGWDDSAKLEAAAKRLLAKFPDDLDSLKLLAKQYKERNEPAAALPLVLKARALKPLDESLRELEWTIRIGLAHIHAVAKQWDAGRQEFTAAEQLLPHCRTDYSYLARRVIFEAKASQGEQSDRYLEQARASLKEPTPLWLALLIESIRFGMTKATQKGYAQLWESELKNRCTSESAGEMASLMDGFLTAGIEYTGRAGHIKKIAAYLQRTTQLKYRCIDIERVCEFLGHVEDKATLLEKLVKLGVKQHPSSALLNFRAGLLESGRGPFNFGGPKARNYLETARKLAESSTDRKETTLLPLIENALTLLNEIDTRTMGFPAFGNGPPGVPFPFSGPSDDFFDFFDDDFDDDDDDDDDSGPRPAAKPRVPRKPKKKKPSKKR
jgi:cation transport regulator ChaC